MHRGRTVLAMDCTLAGAQWQHGRPLNSVVRFHVTNQHHVAWKFINAFLWSVALSPFEALLIALLAPILGSAMSLAIVYFYAPGMYLFQPLFGAIPYGGSLVTLVHMSLAMIVQNFTIWAAVVWWQTHRVQTREI